MKEKNVSGMTRCIECKNSVPLKSKMCPFCFKEIPDQKKIEVEADTNLKNEYLEQLYKDTNSNIDQIAAKRRYKDIW